MLEAWIIEKLKKEEEKRNPDEDRPVLRLPLPEEDFPYQKKEKDVESEEVEIQAVTK